MRSKFMTQGVAKSLTHSGAAVYVLAVFDIGNGGSHFPGVQLEQVRAPGQHGLLTHPQQACLKLVDYLGWRIRR